MAARRTRASRSRSRPLRSAVMIAAMTVGGFGLGALAGAFWEEPDLVAGFLAGETEAVSWRSEDSLADVAAGANARETATPRPERGGSPAGKVPPASSSRFAVPDAGAAVRFAVQVGAFADSSSAERLANSLRGKGFRVYVSGSREEGSSRWRVRVGPMDTREAAERAAARLKAEETLPTWVLDEGPP